MKFPDFSKHVETVTMEKGPDGVYRAVSDQVVAQDTGSDRTGHHSGCWIDDLLEDFGLAPDLHLEAQEHEAVPQDNPCYSPYEPDCDYQGAIPICLD